MKRFYKVVVALSALPVLLIFLVMGLWKLLAVVLFCSILLLSDWGG